jgi:hypothetical protein
MFMEIFFIYKNVIMRGIVFSSIFGLRKSIKLLCGIQMISKHLFLSCGETMNFLNYKFNIWWVYLHILYV